MDKNNLYLINDGEVNNFTAILDKITIDETLLPNNEHKINFLKSNNCVAIPHGLKIDERNSFFISYRIVIYDQMSCTVLDISQSMKLKEGSYLPMKNSVKIKREDISSREDRNMLCKIRRKFCGKK